MKTTVETINKQRAREILDRTKITGFRNRPLNKGVVEFYAKQMKEGKWKENGECIIISKDLELIDGQYRLHAIEMADVTLNIPITYDIDKDVFDTIDQNKVRTKGDTFAIAGIKNYTNVSAIVNKYLYMRTHPTLSTRNRDSIHYRKRKDELLDEYYLSAQLYQDVYNFSAALYGACSLMPATEIGCHIVFFIKDLKYKQETVFDFFNQIFRGENFTNNTIKLFRNLLIKNSVNKRSELSDDAIKIYLLKTWNAFIQGKELKCIKYDPERESFPYPQKNEDLFL